MRPRSRTPFMPLSAYLRARMPLTVVHRGETHLPVQRTVRLGAPSHIQLRANADQVHNQFERMLKKCMWVTTLSVYAKWTIRICNVVSVAVCTYPSFGFVVTTFLLLPVKNKNADASEIYIRRRIAKNIDKKTDIFWWAHGNSRCFDLSNFALISDCVRLVWKIALFCLWFSVGLFQCDNWCVNL